MIRDNFGPRVKLTSISTNLEPILRMAVNPFLGEYVVTFLSRTRFPQTTVIDGSCKPSRVEGALSDPIRRLFLMKFNKSKTYLVQCLIST